MTITDFAQVGRATREQQLDAVAGPRPCASALRFLRRGALRVLPILMCGVLCGCAVAESPAKPAENAASARSASAGTRATTTTALTVASSESGNSSGVTLLATVDGKSHAAPAGSVVFTVGGKRIGQAPVANGSATLTLETLPAGLSSLAAAYEGDSNFLPSQSATVRFYNDDGK